MTKKHFEAIARVIHETRDDLTTADERGAVDILTVELADLFGALNDRFDYDRFLRACGHGAA